MNNFRKWNLVSGWVVFGVAAVVYLMTIEPTASLWDCAEFIATSYKLEVGHPPGAPLFMMIARVFTLLAPSPDKAAMMVNAMSALCGAFTVLFLFWSITHLARKVSGDLWATLGAGAVGALAYCFTDTQWFSAVEGEVYSMSSMFTAMVVWCILQWEAAADRPGSNRWLVLIAYLMGLSTGIHILNLLCIPAIVMVWYFRKTDKVTRWGVVKALAVAGAMVLAVNNLLMPYTVKIGAGFDKVFVNGFGWGVNSGMVVWGLLLFALCGAGLWWTRKKQTAHTVVLCTTFILLGFSSYASMVIRAVSDPPMNSNDPSNPYALGKVLKREQYGSQPIFRGPYFSSRPDGYKVDKEVFLGHDGKYRAVDAMKPTYSAGREHLFPRMWYREKERAYKMWMGDENLAPTAGDNLKYFFSYQLNHMYWRYFLWNFVGRQNDRQGDGGVLDGNWLSGVKFIDAAYLGPQDGLPSEMKENRARNTYFFLPFILGLVGLLWQLSRDKRNFAVVALLFFMMGIALVIYFNTAPGEPRERDYVYAGSFYAFCIWIGLGVLAVREWLAKRMPKAATAGAVVLCFSVPLLLACQNWDDHDRSHRYVARDVGYNALSNALPNAIVMNYGDNDTFPLWYAQEVEGVRPDVRIMNTTYLGAEWYAAQMTHKYNDSDPVPFSLPVEKFTNGVNAQIEVYEALKDTIPLRELIDFIASENKSTKLQYESGVWMDYIPVRSLYIPVDKENAVKSGIVKAEDAHLMVDSIPLRIDKNVLDRSQLLLLDLLASFEWKRPLYFMYDVALQDFGLEEYLQYDGFGYRFVPIRTSREMGRVDADYLWHNLMEVDRYGNLKDPRVYVDGTASYTMEVSLTRYGFARLAEALMERGDTVRAVQALDRVCEEMPFGQIRHSTLTIPIIREYYAAGEIEKGNAVLEDYSRVLREYIMYFVRFHGEKANRIMSPLNEKLRILQELHSLAVAFEQDQLAAPMEEIFDMFEI